MMDAERRLVKAARAMQAAAEMRRPVVPVLRKQCPHIYRQLVEDHKHHALFSLWGRCVNWDENVKKTVVHPAILRALGTLTGLPMRGNIVHAGLQHTYGYLFSLIDTPFGAKRVRWLSTAWERGFGLDLTLLSDRPKCGTLLANATWFLGRIAFRGQPSRLRRLERSAGAVAPALVDFDYARCDVCRIVEQVVVPGQTREISLFTDLVRFLHPPKNPREERALLIYSVQNGRRSPLKLLTAFPVGPTALLEIKASVPARGKADVRLRYNAYVPGLFGRTVRGRRYFARTE
jgi:hypothetical protein